MTVKKLLTPHIEATKQRIKEHEDVENGWQIRCV